MTVLVNGDSITYGQGLSNLTNAWPNLVFTDFNNIAEPGSSNFSIYRRTLEELLRRTYTDVVIGWSGLYRLEVADNFSKPKILHPIQSKTVLGKEIAKNYLGNYWYFKNSLLNVHQLKLAVESLGAKLHCVNFAEDTALMYVNVQSYKDFKRLFSLDLYTDTEIRHEYVVTHRLIRKTASAWVVPPTVNMRQNYTQRKEFISTVDFHPNASGHCTIASDINKYLKI
jgi:hypothetical protein